MLSATWVCISTNVDLFSRIDILQVSQFLETLRAQQVSEAESGESESES